MAASSSASSSTAPPPPSNMKVELDPRLQGWYYNMKVDEDGQRYKSLKAPNGRRFNSLKEAIEYAVKYRSDRYCLSSENKEEGWYLNPISQRIRVLREFGKKKKNHCGTIVASLIKRDSIHFMNLHDDEDYETLKVQELLAGKRAYEALMNQTNAKTLQKFSIGTKVRCRFRSIRGALYPGKVVDYELSNKGYTIKYDDGDSDINVKENRLKFSE